MGGLQEVGLRAPQHSHGHPGCLSPRPQADDRVELARSTGAPSAAAATRRRSSATGTAMCRRRRSEFLRTSRLPRWWPRDQLHYTNVCQAFPKLQWSRARTTLDSSGRPRHKA